MLNQFQSCKKSSRVLLYILKSYASILHLNCTGNIKKKKRSCLLSNNDLTDARGAYADSQITWLHINIKILNKTESPIFILSCDLCFLRQTTHKIMKKNGRRKVQGVPRSQTAALPRHQEERKPTNPNKHKSNKRMKSTKISSLFPKRGNRNVERTEKHNNKMTQGKT